MDFGPQILNPKQTERLKELIDTSVNARPQELKKFIRERGVNPWAIAGKELTELINLVSYWVIYFDPEREKS